MSMSHFQYKLTTKKSGFKFRGEGRGEKRVYNIINAFFKLGNITVSGRLFPMSEIKMEALSHYPANRLL